MKIAESVAFRDHTAEGRNTGRIRILVLALLIGMHPGLGVAQSAAGAADVPGVEVQTRGPVHEAFAGLVSFNPVPGMVVVKGPPAIIEELPPGERPEGDQVTWIPGYWGWDDERSDFLWISGTWRALPPGRAWIPGYWARVTTGYQWTSGYWADAAATEVTYLPAPPASLEAGPNIAAPSVDYSWSPGCWQWSSGRYFWRPGLWIAGRPDWAWIPAHYQWTPRGYLLVGGFWDYPVLRRGVLFAPIYFASGRPSRVAFSYAPSIVIDLGVFSDHLFLRPRYQHFYFGDYYGARYGVGGYYSPFRYQNSRVGYDPIYSHELWEHRQDRDWGPRIQAGYDYRRIHEEARPPRTWSAQQRMNRDGAAGERSGAVVGLPMDRLAQRRDVAIRWQPVPVSERTRYVQQGQDLERSQGERQTQERRAITSTPRGGVEGRNPGPARVALPRSPILGRPGAPPAPERERDSERMPSQSRPSPNGTLRMSPTPRREPGLPPMDLRQSSTDRRPVPARSVVESPRRVEAPAREPAPVMRRISPGNPPAATPPGRAQPEEGSDERRTPGSRPRP